MASSGKRKTTMAKLTRESRLRDRRLDKKARKEARKLAAADGTTEFGDAMGPETAPLDDDLADGPEVEAAPREVAAGG
jgi:hypothetical protein